MFKKIDEAIKINEDIIDLLDKYGLILENEAQLEDDSLFYIAWAFIDLCLGVAGFILSVALL